MHFCIPGRRIFNHAPMQQVEVTNKMHTIKWLLLFNRVIGKQSVKTYPIMQVAWLVAWLLIQLLSRMECNFGQVR